MSGLFGGGGQNTANAETPLTGMSIQSSAYGVALAFGYGRTRVAPNLLWYGDFTAVPHTSTQQMGGKGGGGGGSSQTFTSYTYTASYALALGESVAAVNQVWIDKLAPTPASDLFTIFTGADPQTPWSYLTGAHPDEAIGYSGMAYVAVAAHDMGAHTSLSNHSFDVTLKLPLGGGVDDADPGQILPDLLTNTQYGVTNFPTSRMGDLSNYSAYCRAAGLLLSPLYDKPQAASQIITSLMQFTNSGVFFSEGLLKVTPYGDASITGHGASYTADLSPKADFGEDDFLVSGTEDPVRVKRNAIPETVSGSADAYNQITLEILDRSQDYRPVPVVAQDMVSIDTIGLRPMDTITAHEIADPVVGQAVANLILQRVLNIRATYEWSVGWQWCRLEPTDIVSLTELALGMDGYPVRILTIEEDGDTGGLKFTAEDVPFGIGHHVAAPTPTLGGYAVNQSILPGPTNTPVIFEPSNSLTAPDFQLWIAASGGVNWGGCEVWVSDDGATYRRVGAITNPARHGTLTAALVAGTDPDTTHTLAVELGACRGQLLAGTAAQADAHDTLMWVDGELIAYSGATLTGANAYSLTYLRRGIKGTANATHASGAQFVRIDDAVFHYTVDPARIGSPIWLKFPAFNTLGFSTQALSDVTAYQHTFAGNAPLSLTALSATGGMFQVMLNWGLNAAQVDLDYTEIWASTSNNRAGASLLTSSKTPTTTWQHNGLTPAQTWFYWGRSVDTSGNKGNFYPASATAGIAAAASADASALLTQLNNSLGIAQLTSGLSQKIDLISLIELQRLKGLVDNSISAVGISSESILRKTDTDALASSIVALTASVGTTNAAVVTEATARATADTAIALSSTTLQARLDTGDYAAVKTQSIATASRAGVLEAKNTVKLDVHGYVSGTESVNNGTVSSFTILADKFLVARPDASGTPVALFGASTINGVPTVGINGNLIVPGSIVAGSIAAGAIHAADITLTGGLSSLTANIGTVTAGKVQNTGNTNFVDLNATGTAPFLKVGTGVTIDAAGNASFSGVVLSRNLIVASGTLSVGYVADGGGSAGSVLQVVFDTGIPIADWSGGQYPYVAMAGVFGIWYSTNSIYTQDYWGVTCEILPWTRWSGTATLHIRASFITKGIYSNNAGISWKVYQVT